MDECGSIYKNQAIFLHQAWLLRCNDFFLYIHNKLFWLLLLVVGGGGNAFAQTSPRTSDDAKLTAEEAARVDSTISISLLTCQAGEESYSLYGHTAIRYVNREQGVEYLEARRNVPYGGELAHISVEESEAVPLFDLSKYNIVREFYRTHLSYLRNIETRHHNLAERIETTPIII